MTNDYSSIRELTVDCIGVPIGGKPCRPLQINRVIRSRGDPHHPAQRVARSVQHLHRVASIGCGPVPQLIVIISTYGPNRAVPLQINRVIISRGDPHHPDKRIARSVQHLHRAASLGGGAVTQLTVIISTYGPDRAVPLQIHRVSISRGDPHHLAQRIARSVQHLHRVGSLGGGTVPKLTIIIRTHCPNRAVQLQIHRVMLSRGDPLHPAQDCPIRPTPAPGWFFG